VDRACFCWNGPATPIRESAPTIKSVLAVLTIVPAFPSGSLSGWNQILEKDDGKNLNLPGAIVFLRPAKSQ
jgi:hypothetical protein